ncbi:MAG: hypothetical protein AVDCRST_MAG88-1116, partial [uncultured Thermomicrobiales bacterium]
AAVAPRGPVCLPRRLLDRAGRRRPAPGRVAVRAARGGDPRAAAPTPRTSAPGLVAEPGPGAPRLAWLAARGVVRGRGQLGDRDGHLHPGRRGL